MNERVPQETHFMNPVKVTKMADLVKFHQSLRFIANELGTAEGATWQIGPKKWT